MHKLCIWVFLGIVICSQTAMVARPVVYLAVLSGDSKRVSACLPLEVGMPFYFEFINSIYLAPVRETLVYTESQGVSVVMVESPSAGVFEYYGLQPDGSGSVVLHRRVGDIRIRSHNYENHKLTVGEKTIYFKEFAENGQLVIIKVSKGIPCVP
jgi:hypothetical protein